MALSIESATVGIDHEQAVALLEAVHADVIEEAQSQLDEAIFSLEDAVDQIWRGKSADTFISNMEKDKDVVKNALDLAYDDLSIELSNIREAMNNIDENLVKPY
jgi:uncharacterized protein YukE